MKNRGEKPLKKVIKQKNDRVILVTTFHPALPSLSGMIAKHWKTMTRVPAGLKAFPKPPMVAYTQPKNLRRTLCQTKMPPKGKPKRQHIGTHKCKVEGCHMCNYVSLSEDFKSYTTNFTYKNQNSHTLTCQTKGVIYLITCLKCHKQYVGQSGRLAKDRCYDHLRYIRSKTESTGTHFNKRGHTHWDFQFHIIEKVVPNTVEMRLRREDYWINLLQTKEPKGLNKNCLT